MKRYRVIDQDRAYRRRKRAHEKLREYWKRTKAQLKEEKQNAIND